MVYLTKKQERERFLAEFLRRLREAPPGTRVYMRVGDVFKDADVVSIDELRAARDRLAIEISRVSASYTLLFCEGQWRGFLARLSEVVPQQRGQRTWLAASARRGGTGRRPGVRPGHRVDRGQC
jgi:hypothetical protein